MPFPRLSILSCLLSLILLPASPALADDKEEVLARGPIHEAFAEAVDSQLAASPIVPKQPPAPVDELPPDQRPAGDNVQWLPGYWHYDEDRKDFIWISGFWRVPPPNRAWMPGSWREAPQQQGWQWVPGLWTNTAQQTADVQYLPEPPKAVENGPATPAPTPTAVYIPGVYVYRDGKYLWRAGYWAESKVGWIWIPPHYRWTPVGYIYVEGYWDHPLGDRGMLFAPAYIPSDVYLTRGYYYSPTIVVRDQCMYGALFVRRGYGCYYFGDYFEPRYAECGFVTWGGYRGGRDVVVVGGFYDPMYSYYRVTYRDDPYWRTGVVDIYVGRYRGDVARPPVTLAQQNTVVNNMTVNNTTVINNITVNNSKINNVSMLTPISQAAKTTNMKLAPVSVEERRQHVVAAREMHTVAARRSEMETKLARSPNPTPNVPRSLKLETAKSATPATGHGGVQTGAKSPVTGTTHPATNPAMGTTHPATGATTPVTGGTHPGTTPATGGTHPGTTPATGGTHPGTTPATGGTHPVTGAPTTPGHPTPPVVKPPVHAPSKEKEKEKRP